MRITASHPSQPRRVYPDKTALKLRGEELYFDSVVIGGELTAASLKEWLEDVDCYPSYNGVFVEEAQLTERIREEITPEIENRVIAEIGEKLGIDVREFMRELEQLTVTDETVERELEAED
jgi:hypothetical protein